MVERHGRHGNPRPAHPARPRGAAAAPPRDLRGLAGAAPGAAETWLRIGQVHERVGRRLDAALRAQHGVSLADLRLLRLVDAVQGERASVGRLADEVGSSATGVGQALARLAEDGWLTRERSATDRRTTCARLTERGRRRLAQAGSTHDLLLAHLLGALGAAAGPVTDALTRVAAAARPPR
ncbi:MarR family winged helix-turn-helix transcriptional regulator [Klenkia terrae]|jgi:DNA-binding MarR family transcriptional regulator|uniref:MarR family transcriptional regulator n=1 Tax=Klenkia terrae TaxID=1052259 RepID=A0ABU8EE95_9ACTN|nr:MarR family transcriptional regulator [Klenkia terrae]SSC24213.1 MarR-type HTH domain [Klenkia terrae]